MKLAEELSKLLQPSGSGEPLLAIMIEKNLKGCSYDQVSAHRDMRLDPDSRPGTCGQSLFLSLSGLPIIPSSHFTNRWWCMLQQLTQLKQKPWSAPWQLLCHLSSPLAVKTFKQCPNKRRAKCNVCGIKIKDTGSPTSNFIRHLKNTPP